MNSLKYTLSAEEFQLTKLTLDEIEDGEQHVQVYKEQWDNHFKAQNEEQKQIMSGSDQQSEAISSPPEEIVIIFNILPQLQNEDENRMVKIIFKD